jgi:hypothetical protein
MLLLAGVDLDDTSPADWLASAHAAARFVTGGCCAAAPPPPWPTHQPQQQQHQQQQHQQAAMHGDSSTPGVAHAASGRVSQLQPMVSGSSPQALLSPVRQQPSPVAVRRWVLTQKVLVEQRRLNSAQFRYLTMLGEALSQHGVKRTSCTFLLASDTLLG